METTEWIKVKERLPEAGQNVMVIFCQICYLDGKIIEKSLALPCIGIYSKATGWFDEIMTGDKECGVRSYAAYWAPVPEYLGLSVEEI